MNPLILVNLAILVNMVNLVNLVNLVDLVILVNLMLLMIWVNLSADEEFGDFGDSDESHNSGKR